MSARPSVERRPPWLPVLAVAAVLQGAGAAGAGQQPGVEAYERARYFSGATGMAVDERRAFENLRKSAESGYLPAQVDLGFVYFNGKGQVSRNLGESFGWFRRAAAGGSVISQCMLGDFYRDGSGGAEKSDVQAVRWYRLTAAASDPCAPRSQFQLYKAYESGRGVPKDLAQAVVWLRKSANAGNPVAQKALGRAYLQGYGVARDDAAGRAWLKKSREGVAPHDDEDEDAHAPEGGHRHGQHGHR